MMPKQKNTVVDMGHKVEEPQKKIYPTNPDVLSVFLPKHSMANVTIFEKGTFLMNLFGWTRL